MLTYVNHGTRLYGEFPVVPYTRNVVEFQAIPAAPRSDSYTHWKVEAARTVYRERLRQSPTVEEVAREVGVSPSHLRRLFRQARGQSPKRAFLEIRMEMARVRVESGAMTLSGISDYLGFSEPSAFSRAYKRHFGVSPRKNRPVG